MNSKILITPTAAANSGVQMAKYQSMGEISVKGMDKLRILVNGARARVRYNQGVPVLKAYAE
ncbi:MAG: hypothetical protein MJA84_07000 [Firmicutes bacterium]|nr:hypothetical protein [Bacillota bacterium]